MRKGYLAISANSSSCNIEAGDIYFRRDPCFETVYNEFLNIWNDISDIHEELVEDGEIDRIYDESIIGDKIKELLGEYGEIDAMEMNGPIYCKGSYTIFDEINDIRYVSSTCYLDSELFEKENIVYIPVYIRYNMEEFVMELFAPTVYRSEKEAIAAMTEVRKNIENILIKRNGKNWIIGKNISSREFFNLDCEDDSFYCGEILKFKKSNKENIFFELA